MTLLFTHYNKEKGRQETLFSYLGEESEGRGEEMRGATSSSLVSKGRREEESLLSQEIKKGGEKK